MGMPSVNVSFTEIAIQAIARSERGVVALIIKDANVPATNPFTVLGESDIPTTLSAANQTQIKTALLGYVKGPKKVIVYVLATAAANYTAAFTYFESEKFDYMACPTATTDGQTASVATWIKAQRDLGNKCKVVLPNTVGDSEGVINFTNTSITSTYGEFDTEEYCARIAGLLAGTPLTISATYAPLPEVTNCDRLTKAQMDAAVDAGKFFVFWDGSKVKVARGVNSLTTTTAAKGNQFKKIKIVEAMDMIFEDITRTAQDSYLGKYSNSYDNKCLLISAIGGYFEQLILDGILSTAEVGIDVAAQRVYLKSKGIDVDNMDDNTVKIQDTDDKVFLKATIKILDAIEEITLPITI